MTRQTTRPRFSVAISTVLLLLGLLGVPLGFASEWIANHWVRGAAMFDIVDRLTTILLASPFVILPLSTLFALGYLLVRRTAQFRIELALSIVAFAAYLWIASGGS